MLNNQRVGDFAIQHWWRSIVCVFLPEGSGVREIGNVINKHRYLNAGKKKTHETTNQTGSATIWNAAILVATILMWNDRLQDINVGQTSVLCAFDLSWHQNSSKKSCAVVGQYICDEWCFNQYLCKIRKISAKLNQKSKKQSRSSWWLNILYVYTFLYIYIYIYTYVYIYIYIYRII